MDESDILMRRNLTLMLDRNAVAAIKALNAGKFSAHRAKLEAIDHPSNVISPLFSVVESNQGSARTAASVAASLQDETREVAKFFRRARTDAEALQQTDLAQVLLRDLEKRAKKSLPFVTAAQAALPHVQTRQQAPAQYDAVMELVGEHGLQPADPVALCALLASLGHLAARRLFNVHQARPIADRAFNTLSDLEQVRLVNYLRHLGAGASARRRYGLMTFDKGLEALSRAIHVEQTTAFSGSEEDDEVIEYRFEGARLLGDLPFLDARPRLREQLVQALAVSEHRE